MTSLFKTRPVAADAWTNAIKHIAVAAFAMPEHGLNVLNVWERRLAYRDALATMEDYQLEDAGISPEDAAREAAKPFWRA